MDYYIETQESGVGASGIELSLRCIAKRSTIYLASNKFRLGLAHGLYKRACELSY